MAITKYPPNTIHLGGDAVIVNEVPAYETIRPGMLIERYDDNGTVKYKKHATAAAACHEFALNASMLNRGCDDDWVAGELVEAAIGSPGSTFWALIASGATIATGDKLESAGNGYLRAWTASPMPFRALEAKTATAETRIRVEVV